MAEIKHTPAQMIAVRDAIAETLGDAYDCTRVWSAWNVGTMGPHDFVPVAEDDERMHELTIAALDASGAPELLALLVELVDIEGPCPGTAAWASKVRAAIAKATGASHD